MTVRKTLKSFETGQKSRPYNEAEIAAAFYFAARKAGLRCRVELTTRAGRLDLAIEDGHRTGLLLLIEVKNGIHRLDPCQLHKYRALRIPVLTLCRMREIPRLLRRVQAMLPDLEPLPWSDVGP